MTSKLEFKLVERTDTTHFVCVASNKYGTDRSEILLVVQEPPDTPLNFHVSNYSSRSVSLSWEQPYDGNSRITHYVVQYKNASVTWHWNVAQVLVQGGQQNVSVAGLLPARVYQFRALASNSVGTSNATRALSVTTMEEPPESSPRDVKARTKSSESLFVTWKPPEEKFQNGEILGYYIGYRKTNSSDAFHYKTFEVIPGMPLQGLLTNLQKFTEYTVLIQAYNKAGAGPKSPEVTAMTDEDVPGAPPEDVKCKPLSSRALFVQWSSPTAQINGVLQGYRVLYRALSDWEVIPEPSAPAERVTQEERLELRDLQSFRNYSLEVRAFTRKGDGVPSQPVFCTTLEDVPAEPADIKALVMDSQTILISWRPPKYPNGRLTKYKVYIRSLDGFGLTRDRFDIPAGQTWYRVSHLAEQRRYELWVSAATAAGEGAPSRRVQQAPSGRAPARIASFSRQMAAPPRGQLSLPCLAVGQPPPVRRWTKDGSAVETSSRVRINEEWQLSISPTRSSDSGEYSCEAENVFGSDRVVYSVTVREAWNSGVPAAPLDLRATPAGYDSILLQWRLPEEARRTVQGHYLFYKKEFGEWEQVRLAAEDRNWTLGELQCGTRYQLYLQAFNQEGRGAATPTATVRTLGTAPVAPTDSKLIRINSTSISLNLRSWEDGGCPITSVVVEYKARREPAWTLVSNNAQVAPSGGGGDLPVLDLTAGTAYLLRVTAHNSAGSTVATYAFATLTHAGATVSPELMVHSEYSNRDLYTGINVIVPIVTGVSFLVILAAGLLLYLRRISGRLSQDKYEEKPVDSCAPADLEGKGAQQAHLIVEEGAASASTAAPTAASAAASTSASASGQPLYMPAISLRDVSPYATFRVPLATAQGCPDVVQESVYHSEYGGGTPSPRTVSSQGGAMEVTCRNIQETRRYGDKSEWIPLRNLYLTHRY
ncbi:Down syndrome cell adhesion molecule-like protein 1 [Schistocerca gregaria]|uniref:Down syndrome cell adhesion molecule-like protein 1 n=1 Tax=Schistocerca gregaria TaxID=7010 RepID=UPI00211E72F0|nr:Down syndrome cell adhesion molecule-like protein 1 [Schistocerca gregaria]